MLCKLTPPSTHIISGHWCQFILLQLLPANKRTDTNSPIPPLGSRPRVEGHGRVTPRVLALRVMAPRSKLSAPNRAAPVFTGLSSMLRVWEAALALPPPEEPAELPA